MVLNNPLPCMFPAPLNPEGLETARSGVSVCAPEPRQGPHPQSGFWRGGLDLGVPGQSCPTKVVSISVGGAFWPSTFSRWNLQMVERTRERVRAKHGGGQPQSARTFRWHGLLARQPQSPPAPEHRRCRPMDVIFTHGLRKATAFHLGRGVNCCWPSLLLIHFSSPKVS